MSSPKDPVESFVCLPLPGKIVVYTTMGCAKCNMLKEWLRSRNSEFEEKDLDDVNTMAELIMRNEVVLSAPVLEVEGTLYRLDEIFDEDGRINGKLLSTLEGK